MTREEFAEYLQTELDQARPEWSVEERQALVQGAVNAIPDTERARELFLQAYRENKAALWRM